MNLRDAINIEYLIILSHKFQNLANKKQSPAKLIFQKLLLPFTMKFSSAALLSMMAFAHVPATSGQQRVWLDVVST